MQKEIEEFSNDDEEIPDIDEENVREELKTISTDRMKSETTQDKIVSDTESLDKNYATLKNLESEFVETHKKVRTAESIEKTLAKYEDEIEKFKQDHVEITNQIDEIRDYIRNKEDIKDYYKWNNELDKLDAEEKIYRDKLAASNILKEKIKEAEAIAVSNIMDTINTTVDKYLSIFFPTDPIDIQVLPFKTTKKATKPQINLSVNYKGVDCDLNSLSGGELQRVIVAFNLALSEIFNLPFVLLDECTSNLDQELTNVIVNGIKSNFEKKNVIIIAHQVVSGIFDKVIKI